MKEAIGGSWLYTLAITLIALFTTFVSVTTNYTRTYKIKDHIISIIEANDGVTKGTLTEINNYLKSLGYSSTGNCPSNSETGEEWQAFTYNDNERPAGYGTNVNYCIYKHVVVCSNLQNMKDGKPIKPTINRNGGQGYNTIPRAYYGVSTFFRLDWPILRYMIKINLTGETSTIYMVNYTNSAEIEVFKKMNMCS